MSVPGSTRSLIFRLEVEDGWPPVSAESLPCRRLTAGYEVQQVPLFIKDISVGDVIDASTDDAGHVQEWTHLSRSSRTTIWLLRLKQTSAIGEVLAELRALGCNTTGLDELGSYAVDVPGEVQLGIVDSILASLDPDSVAVAFPSLRHAEP